MSASNRESVANGFLQNDGKEASGCAIQVSAANGAGLLSGSKAHSEGRAAPSERKARL